MWLYLHNLRKARTWIGGKLHLYPESTKDGDTNAKQQSHEDNSVFWVSLKKKTKKKTKKIKKTRGKNPRW